MTRRIIRYLCEKDLDIPIVQSLSEMDTYMSLGAYKRITAGKLNLVDLAGSNRRQIKRTTKINLSLSALGNVLSALVDGKTQHIPYRESKLAGLLQDLLGGNTKTFIITALSRSDFNYEETLSSLRYASRAKLIKNQPKINVDSKDALLKEQADEIKKLKQLLLRQYLQVIEQLLNYYRIINRLLVDKQNLTTQLLYYTYWILYLDRQVVYNQQQQETQRKLKILSNFNQKSGQILAKKKKFRYHELQLPLQITKIAVGAIGNTGLSASKFSNQICHQLDRFTKASAQFP